MSFLRCAEPIAATAMLQENNNNNYSCLERVWQSRQALQEQEKGVLPFARLLDMASFPELGDVSRRAQVRGFRAWAMSSVCARSQRWAALPPANPAPFLKRPDATKFHVAGDLHPQMGRPAHGQHAVGLGLQLDARSWGRRCDGRQDTLDALVTVATLKASERGGQMQTQCLLLQAKGHRTSAPGPFTEVVCAPAVHGPGGGTSSEKRPESRKSSKQREGKDKPKLVRKWRTSCEVTFPVKERVPQDFNDRKFPALGPSQENGSQFASQTPAQDAQTSKQESPAAEMDGTTQVCTQCRGERDRSATGLRGTLGDSGRSSSGVEGEETTSPVPSFFVCRLDPDPTDPKKGSGLTEQEGPISAGKQYGLRQKSSPQKIGRFQDLLGDKSPRLSAGSKSELIGAVRNIGNSEAELTVGAKALKETGSPPDKDPESNGGGDSVRRGECLGGMRGVRGGLSCGHITPEGPQSHSYEEDGLASSTVPCKHLATGSKGKRGSLAEVEDIPEQMRQSVLSDGGPGEAGGQKDRPLDGPGEVGGQKDRPLGEVGGQKDRPLGEVGGQKDRPLGEVGGQKDRPLGEVWGQKDRPLGEVGGQKDRPLGEVGGQKDRPLGEVGGQKDRPLDGPGEVGGQKDRPLGEVGGQKDRPLGEEGGQKDRPLGEAGGQKDRPLGEVGGQKDRPLGEAGGQKDRPLDGTEIWLPTALVESPDRVGGQTVSNVHPLEYAESSESWPGAILMEESGLSDVWDGGHHRGRDGPVAGGRRRGAESRDSIWQPDNSLSRGLDTHAPPNPAPPGVMATALSPRDRLQDGASSPSLGDSKQQDGQGGALASGQRFLDVEQEGDNDFGLFVQAGEQPSWDDSFTDFQQVPYGTSESAALAGPVRKSEPAHWTFGQTENHFHQSEDTWTAFSLEGSVALDPGLGGRPHKQPGGQWWTEKAAEEFSVKQHTPFHVPCVFQEGFPHMPSSCPSPNPVLTLRQVLLGHSCEDSTVGDSGSLLDGLQDVNRIIGLKYKWAESRSQKLLLQSLHLDAENKVHVTSSRANYSPSLGPTPLSHHTSPMGNGKTKLSYDVNKNTSA